MPHLRRSNISITKERICIEAETPSLPTNTKNKKRKLDEEFSPQCHTKYHLTKNKKATKVVYNEVKKNNVRKNRNIKSGEKNVSLKNNPKQKKSASKSKVVHGTNPGSINQQGKTTCGENCSDDKNQSEVNLSNAHNDLLNVNKNDEKANVPVLNRKTSEDNEVKDEEDYQGKYFRLLEMMESVQKQFLTSQQDFEQHMTANDAFVEELKCALEEKNRELLCTKQDLDLCKTRNSELENCNISREQEIKTLNSKVDEMSKNMLANNVADSEENESLLKIQVNEQQDKLDCYKILTGLTLEKSTPLSSDQNQSAYQPFLCSVKTVERKELQFFLSHDREFAEIGYKPSECYSPETTQKVSSFPACLQGQIFFANEQAPKFLIRLLQAVQEPKKK